MWRKHRIRHLRANEPETPVLWWLPDELGLEERLDHLIDRALRRLAQVKTMKEVMACKPNTAKALRADGAPGGLIEGPSIEPAG